MQDLRFVSVEDGWIVATNEHGQRFRILADDNLRTALRPAIAPRPTAPKVPPRQIQQLIRSGRSVDEVVESTGADRETVERFEGPIAAERRYMVEQARALPVRVQQQIDPLAVDGLTFGAAIDARLEELEARDTRWDSWKDPDSGWHIGLDFTTGDVQRNALWHYDPRGRHLRPVSPAAVSLSQQDDPHTLHAHPQLRAVSHETTDSVIPVQTPAPEPAPTERQLSATTFETADLLEALRKRRGERQHDVYSEEFEFDDEHSNIDDFLRAPEQVNEDGRIAAVTPFARPTLAADTGAPADADSAAIGDAATDPSGSDTGDDPSQVVPTLDPVVPVPTTDANTLDLGDLELGEPDSPFAPATPRNDTGSLGRRKSGRPSLPTWDEIVFGTRTDDE